MSRTLASRTLVLVLAASLGCATPDAPRSPEAQAPPEPTADARTRPADPDVEAPAEPTERKGPGPIERRTAAAAEGAIMGTVLGGMAGPAGAAVGAGVLGLYGLIMGKPPLSSGRESRRQRSGREGSGDSNQEMDAEIEERRQDDLEREIEEELARQEELLEQISKQEELQKAIDVEVEEQRSAEPLDPLAAPAAPVDRKLPDSIFDRSERKEDRRNLMLKTLDADRDGRPEIEIAYDKKSGRLLSRQEDTNYDGLFDVQNSYDEKGRVTARNEDTNHDGQTDRWTTYADGRASRVEVDRDGDGVRDGVGRES